MTDDLDVLEAQTKANILPLLMVSVVGQIPNMEIAFSNAMTISAVDYYAQPNVTAISEPLNLEQLSWFAALPDGFIFVGTLLGSVLIDPIGRKKALILGTLIILMAWSILQVSQEYPALLVNRALSGLSAGIVFPTTVSYVTDLSLVRTRGVLGNFCIMVNSGCWMVSPLLSTLFGFQTSLIVMSVPALVFVLVVYFMPESPAWLVKHGRTKEAEDVLQTLRGSDYEVQPEMKELASVAHTPDGAKRRPGGSGSVIDERLLVCDEGLRVSESTIRDKGASVTGSWTSAIHLRYFDARRLFLRPLSLMCLLIAGQACMGIDLMSTYSLEIMERVQLPMDKYLFVILMQGNLSLGYALSTLLAVRLSRRRHFITSALLLTTTWLAAFVLYRPKSMSDSSLATSISVYGFPLTLQMAALFYGLGVGPVLFTMCGEIFLPRFKGAGSGIVFGLRQTLVFTLIKLYPEMLSLMDFRMILLFHAVSGSVTSVFALLILPETHGLTLKQIARLFNKEKEHKENLDTITTNTLSTLERV